MIKDDQILHIAELAKTVHENPDPPKFVSFLALRTLSSLECRGVILGKIQKEGFLDLVATYGFVEESTEQFTRMPLWTPLPITDSARLERIILFENPVEMVKKYPHLESVDMLSEGVTVSAPIVQRNIVIGALGFTSLKQPEDYLINSPITKTILSLCGIYLQLQNLASALDSNGQPRGDKLKDLTDRQISIINLFKEELTTTQMANRLNFSHSTIKQDILKIYHIFECSSRHEVLNRALTSGIIEN